VAFLLVKRFSRQTNLADTKKDRLLAYPFIDLSIGLAGNRMNITATVRPVTVSLKNQSLSLKINSYITVFLSVWFSIDWIYNFFRYCFFLFGFG